MGKSTCTMKGVATNVHVRTIGGGGSNVCHLVRMH